jgi:hypothetical protein
MIRDVIKAIANLSGIAASYNQAYCALGQKKATCISNNINTFQLVVLYLKVFSNKLIKFTITTAVSNKYLFVQVSREK